MMRYAKIRRYDVSNWDGVNTTIFFSGCRFKCEGCFNKEAQDFNYGFEFTDEVEDLFIEHVKGSHSTGICILGGEPFQQDLSRLARFVKRLSTETNKPIHMWSGYLIEDILSDPNKCEILQYVNTLVDGQFDINKKDLSLKYRGSSNQRVIDVQKTLSTRKIHLVL